MTKTREPIVRASVKRQQFAMQELGYYEGEIDGIWGPNSIAAMRTWKRKDGGADTAGAPFRTPNRLPRYTKYATLDSQTIVALENVEERDGGAAFVDRFIAAMAPARVTEPAATSSSPEQVTQAAIEKSEALKAARAAQAQAQKSSQGHHPRKEKDATPATPAQAPAKAPDEPKDNTAGAPDAGA